MLTLSTFWLTSVNIALGALVAWSISNLWRSSCAALFGVFYKDRLTWEESQNMVLIVNCKSALDGFMASGELLFDRRKLPASPQRRRAKVALLATGVVATLALGLNFGLPILVALIPTTNYVRVAPHHCGLQALGIPDDTSYSFTAAKQSRWANAAFAAVDGYGFSNDKDFSPASVSFPEVIPSIVNDCPSNVSACSSDYPFTFPANYTLYREHFTLNIDIPLSLQIFDTCYRPIHATAALNTSDSNAHPIGYFYGPINTLGLIRPYTEMEYIEGVYSPGYRISQQSALANGRPGVTSVWSPNSTLVMGGDTTFLLYSVGTVPMAAQSSDPIFATDATPASPRSGPTLYASAYRSSPIVCDTQYVFCADTKGDCPPLGGVNTMVDWISRKIERKGDIWWDISFLLMAALGDPPIYRGSLGSAAIIASETTLGGFVQIMPHNATAKRELSRLVETGMFMLASYMQLSAVGYWDIGNGTDGFDNVTSKDSLCNKIVAETAKASTIPVVPYCLLLASLLLVVLVGRMKFWPREKLSPAYRNLLDAWILHSPGQMHRELTERMQGRFEKVDTTTDWPTVETYHLGPTVVTQGDTKRFGSAGEDDQISGKKASPTSFLTMASSSSFISRYSSTIFASPSDANQDPPEDPYSVRSTPPTKRSTDTLAVKITEVPPESASKSGHQGLFYPGLQR